jgi:hypothetical protein
VRREVQGRPNYYYYLSDFREDKLNTPNLTLAAETIFAAKLELLIKTLLLERTTNSSVSLSVYYCTN